MERANLIKFLAVTADQLVAEADSADSETATALLREAAETLALGSALLNKGQTTNLSLITKEAA